LRGCYLSDVPTFYIHPNIRQELFFLIDHVKCWVLPCTHAQSYTHFHYTEDGAVGQQLYAGSFCVRVNVLTAAFYVLWFVEQLVHFKQAAFNVVECTGVDDGSGFVHYFCGCQMVSECSDWARIEYIWKTCRIF